MTLNALKNSRTTTPPRAWRHLALCVPLVLLGACASGNKPKPPPVVQALIEAPGKTALTLTDANHGARVVLGQAQELRVVLPMSAWSVARGFEWTLVDLVPGVLGATGPRFERSAVDVNPSEAAGTATFRLRPQAAGAVGLTFVLRRPQRLDPPVQTVSFDVTVK